MVNKLIHIRIFDRSCLYQENFDGTIFPNVTFEIIYFSDHDAIRIPIGKNSLDFHTNP